MKKLLLILVSKFQRIGPLTMGVIKTASPALAIIFFLFLASGNVYGDFWRDGFDAIDKKDIALAVRIFKEAAESGDADASEQLARLYDDPNNEYGIQNKVRAAYWYKRAAALGHDIAEMRLAIMHDEADGIPEDKNFAASVYEKFVHIGKTRKNGKANSKLGLAAWRLGRLYENGEGVEKNEQRAFELYKISYETDNFGFLIAYDLARAYDFGIGVKENDALAIGLYEKVGNSNPSAARRLYKMYRFGEGVPKNDENSSIAFRWFQRAVSLGDPEINYEMGKILLTEKDDKKRKKGFGHLLLAAEKGYVEAMFFLGSVYSDDKLRVRDDHKGLYWLKKAAEKKHAISMLLIGAIYSEGRGVDKDASIAADWYLKAANLGEMMGLYEMGQSYLNGKGVEKNLNKALYWHTKAAEAHYPKSQVILGIMYEKGKGVPKDPVLSHMWHNLAASNGSDDGAKFRDYLEKFDLTNPQKEKAYSLAREWMKLHPKN